MEKIITINDTQQIKLSNSIAWTMEYRDQFGRDVIQDHLPFFASITEALATIVSENGTELTMTDILKSIEGRVMDLMIPLMQLDGMQTILNVTWAMAKACDDSIPPPKQWIRQFDEFPLDVVVPAVYSLAFSGFVSSKNLARLTKTLADLREKSQPTSI